MFPVTIVEITRTFHRFQIQLAGSLAAAGHAQAHDRATGEIKNKKMNRVKWMHMNLNNWNFKRKALENTGNSLGPRLQSQRAVIAREQGCAGQQQWRALGDGSCMSEEWSGWRAAHKEAQTRSICRSSCMACCTRNRHVDNNGRVELLGVVSQIAVAGIDELRRAIRRLAVSLVDVAEHVAVRADALGA